MLEFYRRLILLKQLKVLPIFQNRMGQFQKILHNYFTGRDKIFRVL